MWADAQRNGRPRNISGALSESCVGLIPFFVPRHKVWLTAAAQVPCTNAANIKRKVNFAPRRIQIGAKSLQKCV